MKNELTLGSLFDGSGGFPLAGILSGVTPVWASEIEPFAVRVTTARIPQMKHYGDVSAIHGGDLPPVDIITFGSPCQDMSIAGKRSGLDGSRSSLFYEAIRIVKEMREKTNGEKPRWLCWENVPGAFSSNKGADFKAVLEAIIGIKEPSAQVPPPEKNGWPYADLYLGDGWSVAYRVLDAQYWGVPQRRARIFLVADLAGERAPEVLFKSEGLSGYTPQGFRAWQGATCHTQDRSGAAGGADEGIGAFAVDGYNSTISDTAATLGVNCGMSTGRNGIVLNDQGGNRMDVTEEITATLRAEAHHPPVVLDEPAAAGFCTEHSAKARSIGFEEETAPTLRAGVVPAALALDNHPTDSRVKLAEDNVVQTLTSRMGTGGNNVPLVMDEAHSPQTLKIRSGCEGGGKGAQIQDNKSATLGCNNDQTVFVPFVKGTRPHSAQEAPYWKAGDVANTLNTFDMGESRCNELAVKAYGICSKASHAMLSDNPHSGFYEAKTARTLDQNGGRPDCAQGGVCICQPVVCVDQGGGKSNCTVNDQVASPLACTHGGSPAVAFTQNQRDEVRDLHGVSGALAAEPGMKQQTYVLQGSMIGRTDKNGPQGDGVNEEVSFTLDTADRHAVAYCMTTGEYTQVVEEKAPTLMARDYKDPPLVARDKPPVCMATSQSHAEVNDTLCPTLNCNHEAPVLADPDDPFYIVRRLTPTECARLQGFPDWWCSNLGIENPTPEDIAFWSEVWETHRKVMGTSQKPKSEKQIAKWLKSPYSESAEYRLWGNGVALPCVFFVLSGIVWMTEAGQK